MGDAPLTSRISSPVAGFRDWRRVSPSLKLPLKKIPVCFGKDDCPGTVVCPLLR
jgi:hypothetical protein